MNSAEHKPLPCPYCEYDLTGLDAPRCPECGRTTDWETVRAGWRPAAILFERARGWRKIPAWFGTWLTVLLLPWVFARQAAQSIRVGHAVIFATVCFASTAGGFATGMDWGFWKAWLPMAAAFVILFPLVGCLLDLHDTPGRRSAYPFWFAICCYTSAVMPLEIVAGPPYLPITQLHELLSRAPHWSMDIVIWWIPLALWLNGLASVMAVRNARETASTTRRTVLLLVFVSAAFIAYATAVDVGERLYRSL